MQIFKNITLRYNTHYDRLYLVFRVSLVLLSVSPVKLPDLRVTVAWIRVNHFRLRVLLRVKMLNFLGKLRVFHL